MAKVNSSVRGLTRTNRGWVDAKGNLCKVQPTSEAIVEEVVAEPAPEVEVTEVEITEEVVPEETSFVKKLFS